MVLPSSVVSGFKHEWINENCALTLPSHTRQAGGAGSQYLLAVAAASGWLQLLQPATLHPGLGNQTPSFFLYLLDIFGFPPQREEC